MNLAALLDLAAGVGESALTARDWQLLLVTAGTIALLLLLILRARLHPSLAILASAVALGVAAGMPLDRIPGAIAQGVGNLLGHIALVLGLGAVLGRVLAVSGGATVLGERLVEGFGPQGLPWAMLLMGMMVGLPVFFEVGLVLLTPIAVSAAARSGKSLMPTAMPMLAGLSIVHGLIPPHPAAMLAVTAYHADLGRAILYGLLAGLPAAALAGPGYAWVYGRWMVETRRGRPGRDESDANPTEEDSAPSADLRPTGESVARPDPAPTSGLALSFSRAEDLAEARLERKPKPGQGALAHAPSLARAVAVLLLPVALIFLGSWADRLAPPRNFALTLANRVFHFAGSAEIALLIAVFSSFWLLGGYLPRIERATTGLRESLGQALQRVTGEAFAPIAGVLLILAAAGGLSRILQESGASAATVKIALGAHIPLLVLAWLLAAAVRVSIGSATVAMAITTGILAPVLTNPAGLGTLGLGSLASAGWVRPELLVLATGSGSIVFSHVNDPGFWMIKEFYGLDVKQTLASWSILETLLSIGGLAATLALAALLG